MRAGYRRSRIVSHLWKTTALTTLALGLSGVVAHGDPDGLWQPQIRAIVGADNNGGNAALEGFIPIKQTAESVLFLDVRAKHDFKDASGQDIGLGIRRIVNPDLMLGGYAYLNVENYNSTQFTAGTLGVEAITPNFDAHVNVFVPIKGDSTDHSTSSSLSMVSNQLIEQISVLDHRDYAAWGIEGEIGAQVPINLPDKHSLRLDIGGYHFEDPHGDDGSVTGAKAGFEYTIGDVFGSGTELVLAGEVRDDNRDHTQFAGSVRLNIPFNPGHGSDTTGAIGTDPVYPVSEGLRKRVNERVRGDIGVRIQSQDKTGGSTTRVAINAATNAAFGKFYFADGGLAGAGTQADPTTLDDAVTKAGSGGFVVALGGNGNLTTAGVTLANGQTVIGGGESVTAKLFNGSTATFNLGGSDGTIQGTNVANNVITLGNGNTLNGITITGGADGIFGNNVTGTTLTNVTVTGAGGNGAEFKGNSTNVSASNFTATGNGLDGLHIEDNGTYNFTGTTLLSGNLDDGLDISGQGTYTFATVNALDNTDRGITVQGTSIAGSFTTTGGTVSGNGGMAVFIDPITAHVVLDSITQTGGTSGVVLDHVSGSFTVNGATTISNTTGPAIAITDSPATIRFGDINITNPGADGMSFSGVNAAVVAGNIVISGLGVGTGLDFAGSQTNFTAQSLNISGPGAAGTIGIDLASTTGGASIIITNGGSISGVDTGVRLGISGSLANSANAQFSFGGGSIAGITASLDARGLNQTLGLYAFGSTTFSGPQLFDVQNVIFIGSSATGSGDGSSLTNLATVATADAITDSDAIFVLVNDGTPIDATGGFSLSASQTLASFGNGRSFSLGGVPINVTGDNVQHDQVVSDAAGAATLTNSGAGDVVTLANNSSLLDFNISGGSANGVHGSGVSNITISGLNVSGAALEGVLFDGTNSITANNLNSSGNTGNGLLIDHGDGTYNFTGTTTLSNNTGQGLFIVGGGTYGFETLDAKNNGATGVFVNSVGAAKLTTTGGTISGNGLSAVQIQSLGLGNSTELDVTLDTVTQSGGQNAIGLSHTAGNFSVTGTTTASNTTSSGIFIGDSSATVGLGAVAISGAAGTGVNLTNNTGTIAIGGTVTSSGTRNGVVVSGGSAAITVSAGISSSATAPGTAVKVDGITGGSVTFSGNVTSTSTGNLFAIGSTTAPTGGTISFTGSALTANGGGAVISGLGGTAAFNATAPLTVTNPTSNGVSVSNVASGAGATFGSVTVSGASGNGIDIGGGGSNAGAVTFGTTSVTLGSAANTAGINFAGTNADVTFGTTTVTMGAGANQTGIDFSVSATTADFGVTTITGTGDLTSRGIDLSSTHGDKTITFQRGSSITNLGIGVDLSSGGTTATSANANFTFGDGTSADGLQSSISATAVGAYTVNTIGLDPTLGNYDFDDVFFTGSAHLASAVGGTIMVSQNGGVIAAGTDGLSAAVTTISVAQADALLGTQTFAFVGTVDLSGTPFTLDSGQSITGFGNNTSILTSGTIQPVNVQGSLGATGGNVTGDEGVVTGTGDFLHLLGSNQVRNTAFNFSGASGSVFTVDQSAGGFNNAGGIVIEGVTVSNVAAGSTAFKVAGLDTNLSIINNNVNVAGTLLDVNGGAGNITVTRGTLPNSATPGTLTGGGISIANRTAGLVNFTDKVTVNGNGVSLTGNTGSTVTFADLDITTNGVTAFNASGGGTVNVTTGTINATSAQAVALDGITAGINFASTSASFSSGSGIDLQNLSGTASFGTGTLTNTGSGTSFNVGAATAASGGNATISYGGTIASNGTGAAVSIQSMTGGSVTLSGNLTDSNAAAGGNIVIAGNDSATITFSGLSKVISSGATDAVSLGMVGNFPAGTPTPNTNSAVNFTGGGLDIKTTTGTGFIAFGDFATGTVTVTGTGNKIDSGADGLILFGANVGVGGVTFDSVSAISTNAGAGVLLGGISLAGDVNIGGLKDTGYLGASLAGLSGAGVVNFTGTTDLDVSYRGFDIGGPQVGTINVANVAGSTLTIDGAEVGIALTTSSGTVNVGGNGGSASIGATTSTTVSAISLSGGNNLVHATLNYNGSIKVDTGVVLTAGGGDWTDLTMSGSVVSTTAISGLGTAAFVFSGNAEGVYNISSTIDHTGTAVGVLFDGSSEGTVTFSGTSKIFNTSSGTNDAIVKSPSIGAGQGTGTLNFTNGGLVITTSSGAGFTASTFGAGTVSVSGIGNTITTGTGTALDLDGATVGAGGINFDSISVNGAATGISLNNVSGGTLSLGAVDLEGITSRGVDISGTLGSTLDFTSLKVGLNAANAVGFDLNGAALGASNITAGDFDVDGGGFAGTIGIDMAGTTGTGTIQLGDTVNNNPGPAGQTSTIANVGYGVQFSSATNAKLVFGDGQGPAESSIATTGGQVIHATDSLPTNGDYNFNDVNFTGDTSNLASISVYYVTAGGTGDGSLANPGSYIGAQASTANVVVLIDQNVNGAQETVDLSGTTFNLDDGQVLLAFKSGDAAVDVSQLGVDASSGASAAFHFTTVQNSPIIAAPSGIDSLRPVLQSSNATSVINFATSGTGTFTGGIENLIVRNLGSGAGVAVNATGASSFFLRDNDIAAGGNALDFSTTGAPANTLLLSIDGNTLRSTASGLAASFSGQNISATDNSIAIRSFAGNKVTGGAGSGGIAFNNVRFDSDGAGGTVSAGTLAMGNPGARIQGNGLSFTNTSGTFDLGQLNLANTGGTGVLVNTKGAGTVFTLNSSAGVVVTNSGAAFDLDPLTVNMTFTSVSANSSASGIIFDGVAGTFTVTGATSISNTTGFGIDAINTNTGTFNFNTVTVNNASTTGGGIHVASGTLNVTGLANIDTTSGTGLSQGGGTTSFTGGLTIDTTTGTGIAGTGGTMGITATGGAETVNSTLGQAISLSGVAATIALDSTSSGGGTNNVSLTNVSGTVGLGTGSLTGAAGVAFLINGGAPTVSYGGTVTKTTAGKIVDISGVTGGTVTLSGALSATGNNDNGIYVHGNTGGTFNFNGAMTLSTGVNTAVNLATNTGATVNFAGGLGITTTSGLGFGATGGGTINVTGTNTIHTTLGGQLLVWNGMTVGASGATFNTMTADTKVPGGDAVNLTNVGGGTFNGGTLSVPGGTNSNGIFLNGTSATVNFAKVTIADQTGTATGGGIRIDNNTGAVTISDNTSLIGGFGAVQGIGIDINGGSGNVTIAASVSKGTVANNVVQISGRTGGTVTLSGTLSADQSVGTANGIDVSNNTGGTITFSGANSALNTGTTTAVNLTNNTGATVNFTGGGLNIDTTTATGFNATGGGTINVTGASNTIQTSSGQILNWNGVAVGGSGVTFATLQSTASVAADPINLTNVSGGTFNGGAVTVAGTSGGGDGIEINGSSATFNFTSATIAATAGNGILLSGANGAVTFSTVTIDNTTLAGIRIDNNTNAVNVNGGSIGATNDPTGVGVDINGGTGAVTIAASVTKTTAGNIVQVSGRTAGTVAFSGNLSATGAAANGIDVSGNSGTAVINFSGTSKTLTTGANTAVNLTSNTGATVNFTGGGLVINTTSATGFNATGGGTVTVQGTGNTIASTTGTALNVANTTIGATGLIFRSISSNGAANGIVLNNTGTSGGLTVTGDGGGANNGSGGTIQNSTGDGISLTSTQDVHLAYMNITNNLGDGIGGSGINGFVLNRLNISGNGNDAATDESGINITQLTGTASNGAHATSISNSVISNNNEFEIQISNSSGTLTNLQFINNTISSDGQPINGNASSPHGNLVNFLGTGTSTMGITVTGGSFTGDWNAASPPATITGTGLFANSGGTSMTVNVSGATFTNNNAGIDVSTDPAATSLTFDIENNTFIGQRSTAINHFDNGNGPFNRTVNGTIKNNIIGDNAVTNSGSALGISIQNEGAINGKYLIDGNQIYQIATAPGISVNVGLGGLATGGGEADVTIINNTFDHINGSRAITIQDNQDPGFGPFPTIWANVQGNSFANVAGQAGNGQFMRIRQLAGTVKVTQDSPTAGNTATELDNANGSTDPTKFSISGTVTFSAGNAPLPTTNPLP
ncbi:hypothetical protein MesoLj113a_09750 [Mesorhizobium sp. 113-1-2]|uniref:S-layer family protein n=1 Tax=Mesorhizobium sp. 113-1-2 TaxID=2744515 RepID=UPI001925749E|nr:S-layer family protein [Mesorhizobium sp. 113-1-2]BCG69817.1 hypothetical protein MesoLj113a_09750 [Mesorhizobium sp. 113-1-2]